MHLYKWIVVIFFFYSLATSAQILVDETWGSTKKLKNTRVEASSRSRLKNFDQDNFRTTNKLGVGTTLAGATGLLGVNLHINAINRVALSLGGGQSHNFKSFNLHFKRFFGESSFQPYVVAGYSRWFANEKDESVEKTSPPVLRKKFLSNKEIASGSFSENLLYPGLGVELLQLDGSWKGLSFFTEALLLLDLDDLKTGPTIGFGSIYYF